MINRLLAVMLRGILSLRYRVRVVGLDAVARRGHRGILFLPNHPALIEPVVLASRLYPGFRPRVLGDAEQLRRPGIGWLARRMGALSLPSVVQAGPGSVAQVQAVMDRCAGVLRAGENLILYPAGRVYRGRHERLGANSAAERVLKAVPEARVVLIRSTGFWGSRFSWARGGRPRVAPVLGYGLLSLLAQGLCFGPRRRIRIEVSEPDDLPRQASRAEINAYLEAFYNRQSPPAVEIPLFRWPGRGPRVLPDRGPESRAGGGAPVSGGVRRQVLAFLEGLTGRSDLADGLALAADLDLDSLALAEIVVWLETEYGQADVPLDALETVGDVVAAACGQIAARGEEEAIPVSRRWLGRIPALRCPPGLTELSVPAAFLAQARRNPGRAAVADAGGGVRTYRELVVGIRLLRHAFASLPGRTLGIMLPASAAVGPVYLAALLAGKVPVMINWTLGRRNLEHCVATVDLQHVVTSRLLLERLAGREIDLGPVRDRCLCLEDLRRGFTWTRRLLALGRSLVSVRDLETTPCAETAVILFTSGSERRPKAVPLTHRNLLVNVRDAFDCLTLTDRDSLLGILPPFHAFGLTVSVILPLVLGLRACYYPIPTHGGTLGRLLEAFGASVLVGTPTFLQGIARVSSRRRLRGLRLVITGAETCPQRVYDLLAERCPEVKVLEGYGVTEASPVISVNRPWAARPRTIGRPLGSIEYAIVDPDTLQCVPVGTAGMLLVRGPTVFGGYMGESSGGEFVVFRGTPWYRTGDLISEDASGVWTFRGRRRRFIKRGGEMVSLPAIETALDESLLDVEAEGPVLAVVAGAEDDIVLVTTLTLSRQRANAILRAAGLSGLHAIRRVERVASLPLLGTGKTDYQALRAHFAGGGTR